MERKDCEIVKDLLPNYVEGTIREETKEFVENHIKTCANCKDILNTLEKEAKKEEKPRTNEKEIDFLKKYNKRVICLKVLASGLALVVAIAWGLSFARYTKIRHNEEIAKNVYDSMQELSENNNILVTVKEKDINFEGKEKTYESMCYIKGDFLKASGKDKINYLDTTTYGRKISGGWIYLNINAGGEILRLVF